MLFNEWMAIRSKINETNAYPPVTIQMNKMGHLHVWKGEQDPQQTGKYNYHAQGKESDIYIQNENEVQSILRDLKPDEVEHLEKGFPVVSRNFPDDYFMANEAKKPKKWIQKTDMKKGAFTDYCGGKVTADCIEKGLKSDDPTIVKRASLAKTLRKIAKDK